MLYSAKDLDSTVQAEPDDNSEVKEKKSVLSSITITVIMLIKVVVDNARHNSKTICAMVLNFYIENLIDKLSHLMVTIY